MPFQPGTRLGPYEILSALGAGGMGEVYRARDVRLARDVAIKVLPAAFAADGDRVARFEREAKAIAALSHPNILAIFDTGLHDGHPYVVTELLEGETLAARLKAGPLPPRKAIDLGSQVARGLAAAHDKGVIHRDLKPDNMFVTADGHAKILDFGLAKTPDAAAKGSSPGEATMTAAPITEAGMVMGTVGYMSPEQVRGQAIDARSDLFSLGAVLYEMLTGERAFRRDTPAETMTAILRDEPPDVSTARSQLSPALDRIVHHCLEKAPAERFQTARDIAFALDALSGSGATPASGVPPVSSRRRVTLERIGWIALTAALAGTLVMLGLRPAVDEPGVSVASLLLPENVRLPADAVPGRRLAISPDGRYVAFVGISLSRHVPQLWLRALDRADAVPVEGSDGAFAPFWSPDSRFVAFRANGVLMTAPAGGGSVTPIGAAKGGGAWGADDAILVQEDNLTLQATGGALRIVSKSGGEGSVLMQSEPGQALTFPSFLPDGRRFLFAYGSNVNPESGLYVGDVSSGKRTLVLRSHFDQDNLNVFYAAGHLLSVRDRTVIARTFDLRRLALGEEATHIAGPVEAQPRSGAGFSISQTGVLVYQPSASRLGSRLLWLDRAGKQVSVLGEDADYSNPELSPDGSQLLVSVQDPVLRTRDIWVMEVARGVRTRVTFDPSEERSAVWTADGKAVVYTSKGLDLYTRPLGSATEAPFIVDRISKDPGGFSPDGRFFVYRASGVKTSNDVWIRPRDGDAKPYPFLNAPFDENAPTFSPDGKWLAYSSNESGKPEIYVTAFPSGAGKWQISTAGGTFPRWRRDGKEMFYLSPDNVLMSAPVNGAGTAFVVAAAVPLFKTVSVQGPGNPYDVSADGQRFVINSVVSATGTPSLTVVFNWPQLLKKESR